MAPADRGSRARSSPRCASSAPATNSVTRRPASTTPAGIRSTSGCAARVQRSGPARGIRNSPPTIPMATRLTPVQWLICAIAAIGFAFDIYELLMLPLIIKPAIAALSAPLVDQLVAGGMPRPQAMALWVPGGGSYVSWARTLFFVPAMVGGVFGLLGGYLTDLLGRRRVLTCSILLYAFSACAAGFAQTLNQLLICRCLVFIGVCVEFVAAVAWLAELFPNAVRR